MPLQKKKNIVDCQLIIINWKISVDNFRSQKIHFPGNAAPWNFYCSWGTHPAVCMSNLIKIKLWEVAFSLIFLSKTKKIKIFEKNILSGVNFITALSKRTSYFREHPILDMVFCSSRMFFIFSFFHFPYGFKIYGSTSFAHFSSKKPFTANYS